MALSELVESAARLALAASLLKASSGCVILPTIEELRGSAGEGRSSQREESVAEAGATSATAAVDMSGSTPTAGDSVARPSAVDGEQDSSAISPDNAAFVDISRHPIKATR